MHGNSKSFVIRLRCEHTCNENKLSDWLFLSHATSHNGHLILYYLYILHYVRLTFSTLFLKTNSKACKNTNQFKETNQKCFTKSIQNNRDQEHKYVQHYADGYNYNSKTKPPTICTQATLNSIYNFISKPPISKI